MSSLTRQSTREAFYWKWWPPAWGIAIKTKVYPLLNYYFKFLENKPAHFFVGTLLYVVLCRNVLLSMKYHLWHLSSKLSMSPAYVPSPAFFKIKFFLTLVYSFKICSTVTIWFRDVLSKKFDSLIWYWLFTRSVSMQEFKIPHKRRLFKICWIMW